MTTEFRIAAARAAVGLSSKIVIASAAKQSRPALLGDWIASTLRVSQ
jgi:hypothetical protein